MKTAPAPLFLISGELQIGQGGALSSHTISVPGSGGGSNRENAVGQINAKSPAAKEDEVRLQFESPGEIAVYQFLNQQGSLILQVPPQAVVEIAREISQELSQEAAPKAAARVDGGANNGR